MLLVPALMLLTPTIARADRPVGGSWLDRAENWNRPGASVPPAGGGNLANCPNNRRAAALPEDALVTTAGWTLTGAAYLHGPTTVVMGMADVDGMCRLRQYQVFVFHKGQFAGTLSPQPMDARTDGSLVSHDLYRDDYLGATFARYTPADALCCPSAESYLSYVIQMQAGKPLLVPQLPASWEATGQ
ncbi:LppP/LprE family lipoprotein [Trichothermofontia sichuanensis B231]|uniref:LppP/LprE family lipoprotein n=1 Tax=Trichothermofontia sichuanensis TaxID=3045816 RepID=UPI002246868B|nr:LppP/LprE family lipoprotein [Trichothermofontia sichuanensis]UZQ55205.1 LppP/LprE family lipoprotein [Trichothermofontia sichuanensis B231]